MKMLDDIKIFSVDEFDFSIFKNAKVCRKKKGNQSGNRKSTKNILCAFDIETSGLKDIQHSFMFVWQFAIGVDTCIIGRTWTEFQTMSRKIADQLTDTQVVKIWVHNLSYEFSFLKGVYRFEEEDVFILDGRRVLSCTVLDKLRFQCSYIQSNMSLSLLTKKYNVKHQKQSGEDFDYDRLRFAEDDLSDDELRYCVYDVVGLNEAIKARMAADGDNLHTIPQTSTGYVRRDMKRALHDARPWIRKTIPDFETYKLLEEAFSGGYTHANRFYVGKVLHDLVSFDRASSYPDVMANDKFPCGKWYTFDKPSKEWLNIFLEEKNNALLFVVTLENIRLKNFFFGCPYISIHKCRELWNVINDNGRVLKADKLTIATTDVDWMIIKDVYDFDLIEVKEIHFSRYSKLPQEMRDTVKKYFETKTKLKGVKGEEVLYEKSKNLLNSCYGMCAQKSVKQNVLFLHDNAADEQFTRAEKDEREIYKKYLSSAWLNYSWGVWVTAWARYRLFEGVKIAGNRFVYADTDSVKFLRDEKIIEGFESYNKERERNSKENGACAVDIKGKTHFMGIYDMDAEYQKFKTLGAKKYAYENEDGKTHITIAGVNKIKGAEELQAAGGVAALNENFIFRSGGGLEAVYNDKVSEWHETKDGHRIFLTDNVFLKPSEYTVGLTPEYKRLISASYQYF